MIPDKKIKVLIVDDSAVVRQALTKMLSSESDIDVVGSACDPYVAKTKILELKPDVLTLDIEMPRMDGLTFLQILMREHPLPVIVMSSLTTSGSSKALEAMQYGAVDVLAKPTGSFSVGEIQQQLILTIRAASRSRIQKTLIKSAPPTPASPSSNLSATRKTIYTPSQSASNNPLTKKNVSTHLFHQKQLILLGSSTGGTVALEHILESLPAEMPGICIVQHIPPNFSKAFADRLNTKCQLEVREAKDHDIVKPGLALIAPGGFHMLLRWYENHFRVLIKSGPPVWFQRPAVDVLFKSISSDISGRHTIAGILTGMGRDGAEGLLELRNKGATTFGQTEESCVVYGMPKAAFDIGATQRMIPLDKIAGTLMSLVHNNPSNERTTPIHSSV